MFGLVELLISFQRLCNEVARDNSHDQLNTPQGLEYDTMAVACGQAHTCSIQKTFAEDEKVS